MDSLKSNYTALFFGSFDPVHIGHMIIAEWFLNQKNIENVWFVISPVNPFKKGVKQTSAELRLAMLQLAIDNVDGFKVCDIELSMEAPHYTYTTLRALKEKHPEKNFLLIIGGDNMALFEKWKNYNDILEMMSVYVYPRPGVSYAEKPLPPNMFLANAPLIEVSSTQIRKNLADGLSARFMLLPKVYEFIVKEGVYANPNSFLSKST